MNENNQVPVKKKNKALNAGIICMICIPISMFVLIFINTILKIMNVGGILKSILGFLTFLVPFVVLIVGIILIVIGATSNNK